jgi:hypothetical protein
MDRLFLLEARTISQRRFRDDGGRPLVRIPSAGALLKSAGRRRKLLTAVAVDAIFNGRFVDLTVNRRTRGGHTENLRPCAASAQFSGQPSKPSGTSLDRLKP